MFCDFTEPVLRLQLSGFCDAPIPFRSRRECYFRSEGVFTIPWLPIGSSQCPPQSYAFTPILKSGGEAPTQQSAVAAAACAGRGVALVPSSLVSPVLSPPAGFFANSSPEGRGKPAPAPCACLSHCFQGCKSSHCPRAGQRDIDKKEPQLGNTSGVLGFPCVRFWQSPHMGFACIISQTFHRRRAVRVGEVRHPARRP